MTSLPSSPGKMDLSALGGLKKRALHPVPDVVEPAPDPVEPEQAGQPEEPAQLVVQEQPEQPEQPEQVADQQETAAPDVEEPAAEAAAAPEAAPEDVASPSDSPAAAEASPEAAVEAPAEQQQSAPAPVAEPAQPVRIEPAEEEHSGHVTLYLPGALNRWLGEYHDRTEISYPEIVLNAVSWAVAENRLRDIFAPVDSPIPANDIFGRAPAVTRPSRGATDAETRPLRFRRDHMKVIISLARTWTADNRNAFFVGVLSAYRDELGKAATA